MIFGMITKAENYGPGLRVWVELRGFDSLWKLACQGVVMEVFAGHGGLPGRRCRAGGDVWGVRWRV